MFIITEEQVEMQSIEWFKELGYQIEINLSKVLKR